jgi:outer membrane receptor protein involved in Fe transport
LKSLGLSDHYFSLVAGQRLGERVAVTFDLAATSSHLTQIASPSRVYRFDGLRRAGLAASYKLPLGEFRALRFSVRVDNLFNQTYYEAGFPTPGIAAITGIRFEM